MNHKVYPKITDYLSALGKSRKCLQIDGLEEGEVIAGLMGRPKFYSGAFAIVVPLKVGGGMEALRMFTMRVEDAQQHYSQIRDYLSEKHLPYFVSFAYHQDGINIGGQSYPVVTMDWLEGQTLKPFLKQNLGEKGALLEFSRMWKEMLLRLEEEEIGHGDLQEANIFVQPSGFGFQLRLLDYDSLVIPALEGKLETIQGVPSYQHPQRKQLKTKFKGVDIFSGFVIDLSIRILAEHPDLWDKWEVEQNDSGLLFDVRDYESPQHSDKIRFLSTSSNDIRKSIEQLSELCKEQHIKGLPSLRSLWTPQVFTPQIKQESQINSQPLPSWFSKATWATGKLLQGWFSKANQAATPIEVKEEQQKSVQKKARLVGKRRIFRVGGVDFAMRWIPAGTFFMGAGTDEKDAFDREKPQHEVTITRGFWIGETPVTQRQYQAIVGQNPSYFSKVGLDAPVESVSWYDAAAFTNRVSALEGLSGCFVGGGEQMAGVGNGESDYLGCKGWRLPTEVEWEYAARAGTTAPRYSELDKIAWYRQNSGGKTHPVGQKEANAWGLHDMLGNVWEWCYDWFGDYSSVAATDPVGAATGTYRVWRGGSWNNGHAQWVRAASRDGFTPTNRLTYLGFRVVRSGE
jgi:formylglycine-generating enzyme required for sulfatase activity